MKKAIFKGLSVIFFCLTVPMFLVSVAASEDLSDSSECISCHTDLEEMDDYGAEAASAAAAVAG